MATTALVDSLSAAADAVEGSAAELNRLDGYAGDGDLGITMSQAAQALREVPGGQRGTDRCSIAVQLRGGHRPERPVHQRDSRCHRFLEGGQGAGGAP